MTSPVGMAVNGAVVTVTTAPAVMSESLAGTIAHGSAFEFRSNYEGARERRLCPNCVEVQRNRRHAWMFVFIARPFISIPGHDVRLNCKSDARQRSSWSPRVGRETSRTAPSTHTQRSVARSGWATRHAPAALPRRMLR